MKWSAYIHHLALHFPIALGLGLAAVALWTAREETTRLTALVRWGGWATFGLTTVAAVSGIVTAPGWLGGGGTPGLTHHRSLGLMSWCVAFIAAYSYEKGVDEDGRDWRMFAVGTWCVAALSILGTAHWGAAEEHPEVVPWLESDELPIEEKWRE